MAKRPVFVVSEERPYFKEYNFTLDWSKGFSRAQKMKNVKVLHESYLSSLSGEGKRILEISTKSFDPNGVAMSAFNLKKYVPSLKESECVEFIYQTSKIFENGGPYIDLFEVTQFKPAKKEPILKSLGKVIGYKFEGVQYPSEPMTAFYDWIYIGACMENEELSNYLLQFDAFTDIEFNPETNTNCQARTCAKYVSLKKLNLLNKNMDFDTFVKMFY